MGDEGNRNVWRDEPERALVAAKVTHFLDKMGFDLHPTRARDVHLESNMREKLIDLGLSASDLESLEKVAEWSCWWTTLCYRHASMDVKTIAAVHVALLYMTEVILVDTSAVQLFIHNLLNNKPQPDPFLACLARVLKDETLKFFGTFGAAGILSSCVDGFNALVIESTFPKVPQTVIPGFPGWVRAKSGFSPALSYICFPIEDFPEAKLADYVQLIPSMSTVADFINDILSYYKERVVGDEACYLSFLSREKSCSEVECLDSLIEITLSVYNGTLSQTDGRIKDIYTGFLLGIVEWHVRNPRYKLSELGIVFKS